MNEQLERRRFFETSQKILVATIELVADALIVEDSLTLRECEFKE
jgi:hypothetical protein